MDIIEHWILHKVCDFFKDSKGSSQHTNRKAHRYCWENKCCGENIFKLIFEEETDKEYDEISLDDILFIRTYIKDNVSYVSRDRREWNKLEKKQIGTYYKDDFLYYFLTDELYDMYVKAEKEINYAQ